MKSMARTASLLLTSIVAAAPLQAQDHGESAPPPTPCDCLTNSDGEEAEAAAGDPCFCLQEALYTYPIGGGYESHYIIYEYDDCDVCANPVANSFFGPAGYYCPELCPDDCNARHEGKASASRGYLERPVPAAFTVPLDGPLLNIAEQLDKQYITFEACRGCWIRAALYLIRLPEDSAVRPQQPTRMLALGYEVEATDQTRPTAEIDRRFVRQSRRNEFVYQVRMGGVTYDVAIVPRSAPADAPDPASP